MNATVEAPETIEAGYEAVKNLIYHQVHKFFARYGGDWDELLGEANLAFVQGHYQFIGGLTPSGKPIVDPYHVVIRRWVWFEMFEVMRTRIRRAPVLQTAEFFEETTAGTTDWNAGTFALELGDDARFAATLALYPPDEIDAVARAKGGEPRNYRSTIREHLENLGWREERIAAAFAEIKEAL